MSGHYENLTLRRLMVLFSVCQSRATPHRVPDFKAIARLAADGLESEITGIHVFTEEYNTGYDGVLYRYILYVKETNGKRFSFQIDLLPDQITLGGRDDDGPQAA